MSPDDRSGLAPDGDQSDCAKDLRNQETALNLNLTEHTARNYLLRIFDKLGISSRVELVRYAISGVDGMTAPVASGANAASS